MNSQKTGQDDPRRVTPCPQAGAGPADRLNAEKPGAYGDAHAMTQAARAVMHPERHDTEWRYYHSAIRS